jgi:hypothetical protein
VHVGAKTSPVRQGSVTGERELERELLRKAVLAFRRRGHRCHDCRRSPLTGERVYVYESGRTVCELCKPLRRDAPVAHELVRGPESGLSVKVTARIAL